jgi:hypothetical protein
MTATLDAIANASAHLNNVALPNVADILRTLEALTAYAALNPTMERDPRVARAKQILRDYAPHEPIANTTTRF